MSDRESTSEQPPAPRREGGLREYAGYSGTVLASVDDGLSRLAADPDIGKAISRLGGVAGPSFNAYERAGDAEGLTADDANRGEKRWSSGQIQATCESGGTPLGKWRPIILSEIKRMLPDCGV